MASSRPANKRLGTHIEERRAKAREAQHTPEAEWHDLEDRGTPVEVKSTKKEVTNPTEVRKGRYQLEGENHHQLVEQGGEYDFVLRDSDNKVIRTTTLKASEVEQILVDNGRKWPAGSKLKLRWDVIHK